MLIVVVLSSAVRSAEVATASSTFAPETTAAPRSVLVGRLRATVTVLPGVTAELVILVTIRGAVVAGSAAIAPLIFVRPPIIRLPVVVLIEVVATAAATAAIVTAVVVVTAIVVVAVIVVSPVVVLLVRVRPGRLILIAVLEFTFPRGLALVVLARRWPVLVVRLREVLFGGLWLGGGGGGGGNRGSGVGRSAPVVLGGRVASVLHVPRLVLRFFVLPAKRTRKIGISHVRLRLKIQKKNESKIDKSSKFPL